MVCVSVSFAPLFIDLLNIVVHTNLVTAHKKFISIFLPVGALVLLGLVLFSYDQTRSTVPVIKNLVTKIIPTPVPFNPFPYQWPAIPKKDSYVTVLVGDSMVKALGRNANQLRLDLINYYPGHEFVNYNYGFGSTNILSLSERVNEQTTDDGESYPPIIKEKFDLIIIESFAYNPLSDFSIQEGLQKQTEVFDNVVKQIIKAHPNSVLAIMATIAPSKEHFAQGVYDLEPEERQKWVEERIGYIDNAINFARERNLPLINVYEKSLTEDGKANLKFINSDDFIHPSDEGVRLISQTIADFIYENKIFPE